MHVISTEGHAIFLRSARETITIRAATIFRLICFLFLCTFSLCAGVVKTFGRIALGSAGLHARVSETSLFRARTRELFDLEIIAINSFEPVSTPWRHHGEGNAERHRRLTLRSFRIMARPNNTDIFVVQSVHFTSTPSNVVFKILKQIYLLARSDITKLDRIVTKCRCFLIFLLISRLAVCYKSALHRIFHDSPGR